MFTAKKSIKVNADQTGFDITITFFKDSLWFRIEYLLNQNPLDGEEIDSWIANKIKVYENVSSITPEQIAVASGDYIPKDNTEKTTFFEKFNEYNLALKRVNEQLVYVDSAQANTLRSSLKQLYVDLVALNKSEYNTPLPPLQ